MERTGRPRKLDQTEENQLRAAVFVSRMTALISQKDIAAGYEISLATLRRYYSFAYRTLSRTTAMARYERGREGRAQSRRACAFCGEPFRKHPRCESCKVLLHRVPTERNGGSPDMKACISCFDYRERLRMKA